MADDIEDLGLGAEAVKRARKQHPKATADTITAQAILLLQRAQAKLLEKANR